MSDILEFQGKYRWLSNMWPAQVIVGGDIILPTVEHAYVWSKTTDPGEQALVCMLEGGEIGAKKAKKLGQSFRYLRPDWKSVRVGIMHNLLRQKFCWNFGLRLRLRHTGSRLLVEGNWWRDTFWGVYQGHGQNWLGRLLMDVRKELE